MLIWQRILTIFCYFIQLIKFKSTDREVSWKGWHETSLDAYCQDGWKKQDIGNSALSANMGEQRREVQRTGQCHAGMCS